MKRRGGAEIECSLLFADVRGSTPLALASAAAQGELLVSVAAARAAHLTENGLEHRQLRLKGKREPTEVIVIGPA